LERGEDLPGGLYTLKILAHRREINQLLTESFASRVEQKGLTFFAGWLVGAKAGTFDATETFFREQQSTPES
jgi:hypothetical protein